MSFRNFIEELRKNKKLMVANKPVSLKLDLASLLKASEPCPVLVPNVKGSGFPVAGNVFATKDLVSAYLGCRNEDLIPKMMDAINNPSQPAVIGKGDAPVLENSMDVDLNKLPIPVHLEKDGGPYFTSAVVIANDPEYGRNCSFHRMMVIGKDKVVARVLNRDLHRYIERADSEGRELDIAFVVGSPINVLLAGATSVPTGQDELRIANSLMPLGTVKLGNGIEVPADAEFAFEAKVTKETAEEGPFLDLTETYDVVRKQRVFRVTAIHHRDDAIHHVLLPGGLEHKILMGMPREPTIFNEVNKVAECRGINITPGGCSWLHGVVAIKKKNGDDGKKAIDAAFMGHRSMKHVVVVDEDIDINNPTHVEWAIATRFQADKGMVVKRNEKGSSLDPSADPNTYITTKVGIDATMPLGREDDFRTIKYKKIRLGDYF